MRGALCHCEQSEAISIFPSVPGGKLEGEDGTTSPPTIAGGKRWGVLIPLCVEVFFHGRKQINIGMW